MTEDEMAGWHCCRKGDPFQGLKLGSCLTLGKEFSEEIRADKARDFIGNGTLVESSRVSTTVFSPGKQLCSQGFMVMGLVFSDLWPITLI